MKATKLASTDQERMRLRTKSKQLLSRAEEIKRSENWEPKLALLKVPPSERSIPRNETIILLEASKLHGFIFPPWTSDPEDQIFDDDNLYT
jgi:calpain-7